MKDWPQWLNIYYIVVIYLQTSVIKVIFVLFQQKVVRVRDNIDVFLLYALLPVDVHNEYKYISMVM